MCHMVVVPFSRDSAFTKFRPIGRGRRRGEEELFRLAGAPRQSPNASIRAAKSAASLPPAARAEGEARKGRPE